jgi:hypothetical protein
MLEKWFSSPNKNKPEEPRRVLRPDDWGHGDASFVGVEEEEECYDWTPEDVDRIDELGDEYWFFATKGRTEMHGFQSPEYRRYVDDAVRTMGFADPELVTNNIHSLLVSNPHTFGVERSMRREIQTGEARHRIPPKMALSIFQEAVRLAREDAARKDPDISSKYRRFKAETSKS